MSLQKIPINKIKITENHRTTIDDSALAELMQSIKQKGLLQPIGVSKDGKKGFIFRFGHRRLLACKKLGHTTIDCIVSERLSEQEILFDNLTENMQRKDPSFAEFGRVIHRLEKMDLSTSQIAVRLGLPVVKIRQIVKVYNSLPEKFRKKVVFMERGGGRKARKGCIPAQVAIKIIEMKKKHGLKDKYIDTIFEHSVENGLDKLDLDNVGQLIGGGMTALQALENAAKHGVYTVEIVVEHGIVQKLMNEHRLINRMHLFKKAIYGEIPPIPKPKFVFTGIQLAEKKIIEIDKKPFQKMRFTLMLRAKSKMLTDAQVAALKSTQGVPLQDWTEEQCNQIKEIHDSFKNIERR